MVKDMITRRVLAALIFAAPIVTTTGFATETPVKAEKNPPGDIPDDQVFIAYASPLGFELKVPEGWARTDRADGVVFADKYGKIEVTVTPGDPPTPKTAADAIKASLRAIDIKKAETADRPAGRAVYLAFELQLRAQCRHQQTNPAGKRSLPVREGGKDRVGHILGAQRRRQCGPVAYDVEELPVAVTAAVSAVDLYRFFHIGGTEVRALRGASLNRGRAEHIGGLTRSTRRRRVGRIPGGMEVLFDYANPLEEARVRATITAVSMHPRHGRRCINAPRSRLCRDRGSQPGGARCALASGHGGHVVRMGTG